MYQIFEEESNGNGSLERHEFQAALVQLEDFWLPKYAGLPMGFRLFDLFDKNNGTGAVAKGRRRLPAED